MHFLTFNNIVFLFAIGSVLGWLLEVVHGSKFKKLINPGFMNGPYLPVHGFGLIVLFVISSININFILKILLFAVSTTILELIAGMLVIKLFHIRLWDYSDEVLNFKGIISLKHSMFWTGLGIIFYFTLFSFFKWLFVIINGNIFAYFMFGVFYGIFFLDLFKSIKLLKKIRKIVTKRRRKDILDYFDFKTDISNKLKISKKAKFLKRFFFALDSITDDMQKEVDKFIKKVNKK